METRKFETAEQGHNAPAAAQLAAIYAFYTDTVKSALRLRGYALQLEIERAGTIDEFRALRRPYLDAITKLKGADTANELRRRLDELLYPDDENVAVMPAALATAACRTG